MIIWLGIEFLNHNPPPRFYECCSTDCLHQCCKEKSEVSSFFLTISVGFLFSFYLKFSRVLLLPVEFTVFTRIWDVCQILLNLFHKVHVIGLQLTLVSEKFYSVQFWISFWFFRLRCHSFSLVHVYIIFPVIFYLCPVFLHPSFTHDFVLYHSFLYDPEFPLCNYLFPYIIFWIFYNPNKGKAISVMCDVISWET